MLVVRRHDQLRRSLPHLIDATSAGGRFYFHMLAALAEFERKLISEHTRASVASAKRNGKHVSRSCKVAPHQVAMGGS